MNIGLLLIISPHLYIIGFSRTIIPEVYTEVMNIGLLLIIYTSPDSVVYSIITHFL